ncbi:NAD(P)H-hydrate epimerase [Neorhizobium galegae]|uniref:NAD(P)H-hydrate dehydratase n=1 Tax=Neorhizobium galegae TaxID=399 RepID=UPI001AE138D0|nr:NAD(P)H-hydrate dehydratase [Neorhizobium galegae]MBP2549578.1 NAD(P)H-hydrate epimerase [Neorhizobium galegae]
MVPFASILLTPDEMVRADAAAAASGIPSFDLMERAGQAVAASALRAYPGARRFAVLCGPGNNGGDGYVAARALSEAGAEVIVHSLSDPSGLKGDARQAFDLCPIPTAALAAYRPQAGDVVIDALFGAGLSREVPEEVARLIGTVAEAGCPVLAVDLPSGLCGARGLVLGAAFQAARTVTFMTRKPGHQLMPGRDLCGEIEVFDIGIPHRIIRAVSGGLAVNGPGIWGEDLPRLSAVTHKYTRGHLAVFSGGPSHTGAARLSAAAGLSAGAGLVTVAAPQAAMAVQASALTAVMLRAVDTVEELRQWCESAKISAFVLGPGFGVGERAREFARAVARYPLVADADAITSFASHPQELFDLFREGQTRLVLTPHEGEFGRLFQDLGADGRRGKVERALAAAERAGGVIVYKGADTVIAAPDGRVLINGTAPPWLATAGSGDVLAGIIGALLAQGVPAFQAAAAGVWLHGRAAAELGPGMTAETLLERVRPLDGPPPLCP